MNQPPLASSLKSSLRPKLIRFNKNTLNALELNKNILETWIFNCSRDTVYSLANLTNTLYNEKYSNFPSSKLLIDSLFDKIIEANIEDKSRFSYMINRSHMLLSEANKEYASQKLLNSNFNANLSQYRGSTACYQFSKLIYDLSYISSPWANEQVKNNIEGIANLLNTNLIDAYRDLKELIDRYFGVISAILGLENRDSEVAKRGRELSKKIQVDTILKCFELVDVVDIQDYSNILIFMALYNKPKLKLVSENFNYIRLRSIYKGDSKLDHYHRGLISLLHNPHSKNYMDYLSKVIVASNYIDRTFISLNPDLSIERLKSGIAYKSKYHDCSECEKELLILKCIFDEEDEMLGKRMMLDNEEEISKSIFGEAQNIDNKKGKFDLLVFIYVNCPDILNRIFSNQEKNVNLIKKIKRLLKGIGQEKNIARLYAFLIKKYSPETSQNILDIENRYPSVKKFDIRKHLN